MKKTALVILAAGIGSRFGGGIKQLAPVGPHNEIIMEYSIHDALKAGFNKIIFIIRRDLEKDFKQIIGDRISAVADVGYAYQSLSDLPEGFTVPEGRKKPWGTGQAILCCRELLDMPFAVINADDFYGCGAYEAIYSFLSADRPDSEYAMVGYKLRNTVTENGHVARGVCEIENGFLRDITERTHIEKRGSDAAYTEDGEHFTPLSGDTTVSMNFWGFSTKMLDELGARFPAFLDRSLPENPLKCEYFLPFVANEQLQEGSASVRVLDCNETWYGMTYRADLDSVRAAIAAMKDAGVYPVRLWD